MGFFSDLEDGIRDLGSGIEDGIRDLGSGIEDGIRDLGSGIEDGVRYLGSAVDDYLFQPLFGGFDLGGGGLDSADEINRSVELTLAGNDIRVPVIYGLRKTGGIRVATFVTGANNEWLHSVFVLCEGEIDSATTYIEGEVKTGSEPDIDISFRSGAENQVAITELVNNVPEWTTDHKLSGLAYVYTKIKYDPEKYSGYPKHEFLVKGKIVTIFSPSIHTGYSRNPALCLFDFITNHRYGLGMEVLNISEYLTMDLWHNELIQAHSDSSDLIERGACDLALDTNNTVKQNLEILYKACQGFPRFQENQYFLELDQAKPVTFNFDESNIIGRLSVSLPSKRSKLNKCTVRFVNPDKDYQPDVAVYDSAALLAEDGDIELSKEITLGHETNYYRALALAEREVKKSRDSIICSFPANISTFGVRPGNVVSVSYSQYGWDEKEFLVVSRTLKDNGNINFSLVEYYDSFYDREIPPEKPTAPDTNLPSPFSVIPPTDLQLFTGDDQLIENLLTSVRISWTPTSDFFAFAYQIEYTISSEPGIVKQGPTVIGKLNSETVIYPVPTDDLVTVSVYAVNAKGIKSAPLTDSIVAKGEDTPETPGNFSISTGDSELLVQSDGIFIVRAKPSWTVTESPRLGFELQYKIVSSSEWTTAPIINDVEQRFIYLDGLVEGSFYDFRVRALNRTVASPWVTETAVKIIGKTAPPDNIQSATAKVVGNKILLEWQPVANKDLKHYEIRHGGTWGTSIFITEITATSYLTDVTPAELQTYLIKAVDTGNRKSVVASAATIDVQIPTAVTPRATVVDNNVILQWGESSGTFPIKGYEIRKGDEIETSQYLYFVNATGKTHFEQQAGNYTYWLIPVDIAGNTGPPTPISAEVDQPPDYTLAVQWQSDFSGTKSNCLVENGGLVAPVNTTETYIDHFVNNSWLTWQDKINAGYPRYIQPNESAAHYEEEFDYGTVLPSTRITVDLTCVKVDGVVSVPLTISYKQLDTDPWIEAEPGSTIQADNFRYVKVRLDFVPDGDTDLVKVTDISVRLDTKKRYDSGKGNVTDSVGGEAVVFNYGFIDIENITVSAFDSTKEAIFDFVDGPNPTGFTVYILDRATANKTTGSYGWSATGY